MICHSISGVAMWLSRRSSEIYFAYDTLDSVLRYISTRLLYMVPVIWLVVSVVFLLIHLVPGDPIQQMLGEGAASADVQAARHAYGLDVPLPQ
jgi:hypothetical protein